MKNSLKLTVLTAGIFLGALTSNASANLVQDGDFNNTNDAPPGFGTLNAGDNIGGVWNVTSGSVDLIGNYWQAPTGDLNAGSVDLDGNNPGAISQFLVLSAGNYALTFDLSGNPDGAPTTKLLDVSVGNKVNDLFTYTIGTNTKSDMQYVSETLDFTTTGNTNLVFASADTTPGFYGPVVGGVVINKLGSDIVGTVPLPAGMPMFIAALLGMFGFHVSRKRQQLA